jgi:deoxyribose-phosphate aldolase
MIEEETAAGGVVVREDTSGLRVLLIEDRYGHWTWPKGHTESGETPADTATREITEETGQGELEILADLGEQEYGFTREGKIVHKKVRIFLIRAVGQDELKPQTSEILRAEWFRPEEAARKIEYAGSKGILAKGVDIYKQLYMAGGER